MKQIVTLEKEIAFKTMVGEISSISLEPDLAFINDSEIEGNLIISGTYKMTEASTIEEEFNYKIPVEIMLTTSLDEEKRKIDINNFTYQIVNEEALEIKIEVLIEGLEKIDIEEIEEPKEQEVIEEPIREEETKEIKEEPVREEIEVLTTEQEEDKNTLPSFEEVKQEEETKEITTMEEPKKEEVSKTFEEATITTNNNDTSKEVMDSIFSAFANTPETYATYSIYILREDDNLEEVMAKYKTTREELSEYNDLDNLKIGTKLIIPTTIKETNEG